MIKTSFGKMFRKLFRVPLTKKSETNNVIVGRWKLDYDSATQNRKVYWANVDHCGCCGDVKKNEICNKTLKEYNVCKREESEEYILPYVM